jgi:hypothetical protein
VVRKFGRRRSLESCRHRQENNIKRSINEIGC